MSSLLLEIVNVYPALSPPSLTAHASNRVCNALALLQCVASHSETRSLFLNGRHTPTSALTLSPRSSFPVSFPQHDFKDTSVRIPQVNVARSDWCFGQGEFTVMSVAVLMVAKREFRRDQLPPFDRDYSPLPAHHGDGL